MAHPMMFSYLSTDALEVHDLYEKGRLVPLGHWITVPYNGASFTASGGTTWTVEAADLLLYAFTAMGQTAVLSVYINNSSVSSPCTELDIALPPGFTEFPFNVSGTFFYSETGGGGPWLIGNVAGTPGMPFVRLTRDPIGALWSAGVNTHWIRMTFLFPMV